MKRTVRVTIEAEYEVETDWYPDGSGAEDIVAVDLEADAAAFLDNASWEIKSATFVEKD